MFLFLLLFSIFQPYTLTAIPKSLLRRPSKKVETYVQNCVPIYLSTILSYASFISDSDHLTCSLIQFHTACSTARSPNTCYSPTTISCRTQFNYARFDYVSSSLEQNIHKMLIVPIEKD